MLMWRNRKRVDESCHERSIVASTYVEPFGGVQVESLLSGTLLLSPQTGVHL